MRNKYLEVFNDIASQIKQGSFEPQSKLPSEHELATTYETSRETVRKALNLLAQNGYIQKIRGKGSIVLDLHKYDFPVSGLVSFKEIANVVGGDSRTHVHEVTLNNPTPDLRRKLELDEELVWHVVRVREMEGERIILDKDYINQSIVPTLTRSTCEESIYRYIEEELELDIGFAKKEITVEEPSREDLQLLDFESYSNIVVIRNFVYLKDARLFQYTESRHRPDKFRFVDFARREKL
ncbi:GntR family transcriptional regulator [Pontibacillus halophilus JSM 076056 = DSM 19796]|uniref:Trehalose operon repressor n=1 Tax=Pontibacillus halophilus JSM 076056 = DSM 19796 TaxID=1385510 RepID=A0A0A5GNZ6_9BACI|nr:trehalose operon repressor [Pontibacillus halophilus]KGX92890.1 GntR family transcriptional regulator [Pontibacillus halophilus JSM 076056 = DSM 19796]